MKNIFGLVAILALQTVSAQFKINIETTANFTPKELYLYSLNGSKDILNTKEIRKGNSWQINVDKPYVGMMKIYFPESNVSLNFISENKDVKIKFDSDKNKITTVEYLDESNALMNSIQDVQQKQQYILPALYQMKEYYKGKNDFGLALEKEIGRLSATSQDLSKYPFINYYRTNYNKFVEKKAGATPATQEETIRFLSGSNEMLESSSLMREILMAYLNMGPKDRVQADVDKLLTAVNLETPRGQTVLSELIDIFNAYEMTDLKTKYLTEAQNLKCTINDRLASTIATNRNTEIGSVFPNNTFKSATNTKAKSIYDLKADKKVVVFWASTCSHCEAELPKLIEKYAAMKSKNIEVIALSLDSEKAVYDAKVKNLPWVNDSELRGWYSSYGETYNVHATPTYFVLDRANKIIAKPDHAADVINYLNLN